MRKWDAGCAKEFWICPWSGEGPRAVGAAQRQAEQFGRLGHGAADRPLTLRARQRVRALSVGLFQQALRLAAQNLAHRPYVGFLPERPDGRRGDLAIHLRDRLTQPPAGVLGAA